MKCKVIQDLLPSYLDDICSQETKKIVESHLNECEDCKRIIDELRKMDDSTLSTINENKPFKKIIKKQRMKIFILCISFIFLFLLLGTRVNSEFIKFRFNHYVNTHYSEYNLSMIDFEYKDPSSEGFGINNGFYSARFKSQDKDQKDIEFNVFTDGFIFSIKDSFYNHVEKKNNTRERLVDEYESDIKNTLFKQKGFYLINASATVASTEEYFDTHIADKVELNSKYYKGIDKIIPIHLTLEVNATMEEIENIQSYITLIINEINQKEFNPLVLTLIVETEKDSYQINNIDCNVKIESQNSILEKFS